MTRKDYVFLTDEFKSELEFYTYKLEQKMKANCTIASIEKTRHQIDAISYFAETFGKQLKLNNKAFDVDRWNKEVGIE